jgi:hypothetical protein
MPEKRMLPKKVEDSKIIQITKPSKEHSTDPSKYCPVSLLNIGGKVLEKLPINRINHHRYKNELIDRQYRYMPQKSTTDTAMEVKKINRTRISKKESCYNDHPRRQRSFRFSMVAKHPKGFQRFRMPQKFV